MIEYLGGIATALFVSAMAAQAIKSHKDGHSRGVSHLLIWQIGFGYILMGTYVVGTIGWDWILMSSYIIQSVFLSVVIKYKYWPPRRGLTIHLRRKGDIKTPGVY